VYLVNKATWLSSICLSVCVGVGVGGWVGVCANAGQGADENQLLAELAELAEASASCKAGGGAEVRAIACLKLTLTLTLILLHVPYSNQVLSIRLHACMHACLLPSHHGKACACLRVLCLVPAFPAVCLSVVQPARARHSSSTEDLRASLQALKLASGQDEKGDSLSKNKGPVSLGGIAGVPLSVCLTRGLCCRARPRRTRQRERHRVFLCPVSYVLQKV
jgi:hypothetical protein